MKEPSRLVDYPYVLVRVDCRFCRRRGQYRLARLAAKWGCDITLDEMVDRIAHTCPFARPRTGEKLRKYQAFCGARLPDLELGRPPPDLPPSAGALRLVQSADDDAA